jgi:hypothetical protein
VVGATKYAYLDNKPARQKVKNMSICSPVIVQKFFFFFFETSYCSEVVVVEEKNSRNRSSNWITIGHRYRLSLSGKSK